MRTSFCAAFSCTCSPMASSASATMASSPMAIAAQSSPPSAGCSPFRHHRRPRRSMMNRPHVSRVSPAYRAPAAAAPWRSSKSSRARAAADRRGSTRHGIRVMHHPARGGHRTASPACAQNDAVASVVGPIVLLPPLESVARHPHRRAPHCDRKAQHHRTLPAPASTPITDARAARGPVQSGFYEVAHRPAPFPNPYPMRPPRNLQIPTAHNLIAQRS